MWSSRCARVSRWVWVLLGSTVVVRATEAADAALPEPSRVVTAQRAFVIPFELEAPQEPSLAAVEVRLFLSRDHGANWELVDRANPTAMRFNFRAPADGEYRFSLQTVDRQGRVHPTGEPRAGLIVIVDPSHQRAAANPPPTTPPPASAEPLQRAQPWPADSKTDVPVEREGDDDVIQRSVGQSPRPSPIHSPVSRRLAAERFEASDRAADLRDLPRGERPRFVATRRLRLACQIENVQTQDLQHVALWQTADAGATWRRVAELQSPEIESGRPFQIEAEHDGLFGFRLASSTKRGDGERPPRPGDTAEAWAFVDTAPPKVEITRAAIAPVASGDPTPARLVVEWRAQDATLADRGVSLAYSDKSGGPWTTFAAGLASRQRRYEWPLEGRLPQRLYIQIEARDEAGNVGRHGFADPVIVP